MVDNLPRHLRPTGSDRKKGPHSQFVLGVDLGQSVDPSALALVERCVFEPEPGKREPCHGEYEGATEWRAMLAVRYALRAVELLPLGTKYQAIVAHVHSRYVQASCHGRCNLVFDETGARAAGDMIRAEISQAVGCVLTGSEEDNRTGNGRWSVSKPNMITSLIGAIENGDLPLADDLTDLETFKAHMVDLRRKVSALGHFSFNAREGGHDDYATAAGLAWWWASTRLCQHGGQMVKISVHPG